MYFGKMSKTSTGVPAVLASIQHDSRHFSRYIKGKKQDKKDQKKHTFTIVSVYEINYIKKKSKVMKTLFKLKGFRTHED